MAERETVCAHLLVAPAAARRLADLLTESLDPDDAVGVYEAGPEHWGVEVHFARPPDEDAVRALVAEIAGAQAGRALAFAPVAARDWVAASLAGLTPVAAGRFLVHGAHHRAAATPNRLAIEIEAALAFGTGHHGTTRGCLLALDALVKARGRRHSTPTGLAESRRARRGLLPLPGGERGAREARRVRGDSLEIPSPPPRPSPRRGEGARPSRGAIVRTPARRGHLVLDLGTGTGVLAIAAAKALRRRVLASDIDPRAVTAARANARLNRVGPAIEIFRAGGLADPRLARRRFDLVFANILLGPLKLLGAPLARRLAPGAHLVLSGLLAAQANAALAAYRAQGLRLVRRVSLDGWVTLVMRRS